MQPNFIECQCDKCGATNKVLKSDAAKIGKDIFCHSCENKIEFKPIAPIPTTWTCRCCETEYQDDFRCISSKNVCMNCCACAFGMSKPDLQNAVCVPIQLKDVGTFKNDNNDLPF